MRLPLQPTRRLKTLTDSGDSGQTLLETTLCLTLLLLLTMSAMDFGYLFWTKLTLQSAVLQAGRYAITGQCIVGTNGQCSTTRYESIVQTLQTHSLGLLNPSNRSDVVITCSNTGGGCPNNAGGPGDEINISVSYPYPFISPFLPAFFPNHSYSIQVNAAFTNEPFPPGQS